MPMSADEFVAELVRVVPEVQVVVTEHLQDNDELLLHLVIADLRRYAIQAFKKGHADVLGKR